MNNINKKDIAVLIVALVLVFFAGLLVGDVKSTLSFNQMLEEEKLYLVDQEVVNSCISNINYANLVGSYEYKDNVIMTQNTTSKPIK